MAWMLQAVAATDSLGSVRLYGKVQASTPKGGDTLHTT